MNELSWGAACRMSWMWSCTARQRKTRLILFSHGFKLDDYVTFLEYLDMTPFSASRKDDYGLGKRGKVDGEKEGKRGRGCVFSFFSWD